MSAPIRGSNRSPFCHDLHPRSVPIARLKCFSREIRSHPAKQIRKLAKSVDAFGFVLPVLIDEKERVVGGWALVLAARRLGLTSRYQINPGATGTAARLQG
jgi:hypothetical protein